MQTSKLLSNKKFGQICFSVFSNIVVLIMSLVIGFLLPKYVSMETYASYKEFTLYCGYLGLFHIGFINGVYLKFGGKDYDELPKQEFRSYTRFLILLQLAVQMVLFLCFIPYHIETNSFISPYTFVIINLIFINVGCYFNLINQFTRRFVIDGTIQLVQKLICVVGIVILLVMKNDDYVPYLIILSIANFLAMIFAGFYNRELVFGKPLRNTGSEIKTMISHGFFIMISEYMGLIIIGIDSVVINLLFSQTDFSIYAFAVSLVTVMYQLTAVISKPIFPYLKRQASNKLVQIYDILKESYVLFSALIAGMAILFPWVIRTFISKYTDSIPVLQILAITVIFKAVHELLFGNYFKALSLERLFVKTNLIAVIVALLTDIIAYLVFHSMSAIAIASLISFVVWYSVTDIMLQKKMESRFYRGNILLVIIVALFYTSAALPTLWGAILYFSVVIVLGLKFILRLRSLANKLLH